MDDSQSVRVGEAGGEAGGLGAGQAAAHERPAGHQLHDDARQPVVFGTSIRPDEVRVVQARRDPCFAQKALPELGLPAR